MGGGGRGAPAGGSDRRAGRSRDPSVAALRLPGRPAAGAAPREFPETDFPVADFPVADFPAAPRSPPAPRAAPLPGRGGGRSPRPASLSPLPASARFQRVFATGPARLSGPESPRVAGRGVVGAVAPRPARRPGPQRGAPSSNLPETRPGPGARASGEAGADVFGLPARLPRLPRLRGGGGLRFPRSRCPPSPEGRARAAPFPPARPPADPNRGCLPAPTGEPPGSRPPFRRTVRCLPPGPGAAAPPRRPPGPGRSRLTCPSAV